MRGASNSSIGRGWRTCSAPLLLLASLAVVTAAVPVPPMFHPTAVDSVREWANSSAHRCVGHNLNTRACYFRDVIFDKRSMSFSVIVGNATTVPASAPTEFLRLGIGIRYGQDVVAVFFRPTQFPPPEAVCVARSPVYIHRSYHGNGFGHVLRDNLHSIAHNLYRLGLEDQNVTLALNETTTWSTLTKYAPWAVRGVVTWRSLLASCSRRYVVFRHLVVGNQLVRELRSHTLPPSACAPVYFLQQRALAYRLAGLPHVDAARLPRVNVLILDKRETDPRRISNIPELLPALRARFPELHIESRVMSRTDVRTQLKMLSETSILVGNVGSASFRLIYLPTGSHAILVGPPERTKYEQHLAFREVDACWQHIQYVKVDRYHLSGDPSQWTMRCKRPHLQHDLAKYNGFLWWDSDARLNATRLGDMIAAAVEDIRHVETQ